MIRIINSTHCQVLHRRIPHVKMLNIIEKVNKTWALRMLNYLMSASDHTLIELVELDVFPEEVSESEKKNMLILLLSVDFSYYEGKYRIKKDAYKTGFDAYATLSKNINEYLSSYENFILSK